MKLTACASATPAAEPLGAAPPSPKPTTLPRESWLDRLARHLGTVPVDHVMIPPPTFTPAPAGCASADVSCSE